MPDNSATLHESPDVLPAQVIDQHRAIASLMEELEAIDWYNQRVHATQNDDLRAILAHNRDEEKEHAMMVLEWLRRQDPVLDGHMRTYLFTELPITEIETVAEAAGADAEGAASGSGDLGIGDQRNEPER
jgi:ferritin-like protein